MGLRNTDLGRDRLWEFNDLAQHTRFEMPSYKRGEKVR